MTEIVDDDASQGRCPLIAGDATMNAECSDLRRRVASCGAYRWPSMGRLYIRAWRAAVYDGNTPRRLRLYQERMATLRSTRKAWDVVQAVLHLWSEAASPQRALDALRAHLRRQVQEASLSPISLSSSSSPAVVSTTFGCTTKSQQHPAGSHVACTVSVGEKELAFGGAGLLQSLLVGFGAAGPSAAADQFRTMSGGLVQACVESFSACACLTRGPDEHSPVPVGRHGRSAPNTDQQPQGAGRNDAKSPGSVCGAPGGSRGASRKSAAGGA